MRFLFERGSVEIALLFPLFWLHNGRQALTAPTRGGAHPPAVGAQNLNHWAVGQLF